MTSDTILLHFIHRSPLPPPLPRLRRSSPAPGRGQCRRYPRQGHKHGEGRPGHAFAGIIPYAGPRGYHPGRGRGGNPLPVKKNHTVPPQRIPPRSGGSRGKSPARAQPEKRRPGGGDPDCAFHRHLAIPRSPLPPPLPRLRRSSPARGGGSSRDIPGKGTSTGKAGLAMPPLASSHTPYRGEYHLGVGTGETTPYTAFPHPTRRQPYNPGGAGPDPTHHPSPASSHTPDHGRACPKDKTPDQNPHNYSISPP